MSLIKGLLIGVLATGWVAGCSDDTTSTKKDKGVVYDQKVVDSRVDMGTDSTPPTPDGAPDQLVKQDTGPTPDGPKADLPVVDQGPTGDLPKTDGTVVTPDQAINSDQGAGGNTTCANAQLLTLAAGAVTVNGDTTGVADEFPTLTCPSYDGGTYAMAGGQRYYKFNATKDQWYKVLLTAQFSYGYAILFTSTACTEAAIQTDCQSLGATGEITEYGQKTGDTRAAYFKAPATGIVNVVVDSEGANGAFTLDIEEMAAVTNGTCANAAALTFNAGKASLRGDIGPTITPNEYGTSVDCGGSSPYEFPQAYYKFTAAAGQLYKISLTNTSGGGVDFFQTGLFAYVFQAASCGTAANINTDCGSSGATGAKSSYAVNGATTGFTFSSAAGGDFVIAIDTQYAEDFGGFTLTVEEAVLPTNDTCANAKAITLSAGKATETGDTLLATDTLDMPSSGCTGYHSPGHDLFYKLAVTAGKFYSVKLESAADTSLYVLQACAATPTCIVGSDGGYGGDPESVTFKAATTGDVIIGVDGSETSENGAFTLTIEEKTYTLPVGPTLTAPFSLDFESSNGTLVGNGDWEWGQLAWPATTPTACDGTPTPPPSNQGHVATQTGMWGTKLNDCYANVGNAEGATNTCVGNFPENDSVLTFKVDLTQGTCAAATTITLSVWNYTAGVNGFDKAMFFVNGTLDATSSYCTTTASAWTETKIDLSALKNTTAEIAFAWAATNNTNDAGWYIDEIAVTCQ